MIGLVFAIPFLIFWATGRLKGRFWPVLGLFVLGGMQGAVGWWMVTSGLFGRLDVSPVRLAIHLGLAFTILVCALWLALEAFGWPRKPSQLGAPRWAPAALMALVFCQVMFGALLAGSDGGPAYPDWPMIGHQWIPSTAFNLVALSALAIAALAFVRGTGAARGAGIAIGAIALAQACLGIATVLTVSPLSLSLAHQAGAAVLWMASLVLLRANVGSNHIPSSQVSETKQ
jgi:cytochrome c oxidase assembly protein subunit 15